MFEKIAAWIKDIEAYLLDLEAEMDTVLIKSETSLLRLILSELLPLFDIRDGNIRTTVANMTRANLIERIMNTHFAESVEGDLIKFAEQLLEVAGKNAEYYIMTGFDEAKVASITEKLGLIRARIGIDSKGALIKEGYLYRLGLADSVRQELKNYVVNSVASGQSLKDFTDGFRLLIKGNTGINGALRNYWQNYAYDAYNQVREISNIEYANELNLKYFIYQGGTIKTSRDFCVKKNGRVFTTEQAKEWVNDPDLIDQKHKATYSPLIDRGRYDCRHFIAYISDELALQLKAQGK